jgi:hypothetical protein
LSQLTRRLFNRDTQAQDRNLLSKFKHTQLQGGLIKDADAASSETDLRRGRSVVCVFYDHTGAPAVYVGRVAQIVALQPKTTKTKRVYDSVSQSGSSARFVCHPWSVAHIGQEVQLVLAPEAPRFYALVDVPPSDKACTDVDADYSDSDSEAGEVCAESVSSSVRCFDLLVGWGTDGTSPTIAHSEQQRVREIAAAFGM